MVYDYCVHNSSCKIGLARACMHVEHACIKASKCYLLV
jgi:hypothetical protein